MKKALIFSLLIIIGVLCYYKFIYLNDISRIVKITEDKAFEIDKYSIFGTHFNISGCIDEKLTGDLSIILKSNKEEIIVDSIFDSSDDKTCFVLSDKNNEGIYLDNLKIGNYVLLIKETKDKEEKFYSLENKTDYDNLEYYTITRNNKNNKINIDFDNYKKKSYLNLKVVNINLPEDVFDICIDPGHGGNDPGSSYKLNGKIYNESDLTLKVSLKLKEQLEQMGLKVKLTREDDIYLDPYGDEGRAVIPNEVNAKYSLSLHLNSAAGVMNYGGVEVYIPNDVNYDFASMLADNISNIVNYSKKPTDKITDGVYFTYFTKQDINESSSEMINNGMKSYEIKAGSPYMYMIREVGGINTGAYVDGRNNEHGLNKYYNSNKTAEPYLIELCYINYKKDLENISKKSSDFSTAISDAIKEHLNIS